MANVKPPRALYNIVRVEKNTKMCKIPKYNRVTLYLSAFVKILQKDVNKDQKRHKADTKNSTTHDESSETMKLILIPETTQISTRMQESKNLNGMCLDQNLENRMSQDMSLGVQNRTYKFDCINW